MKPSRHLVGSVLFSLVLAPWLAWRSLLVFAGGALLDLDRYLWHMACYRTLKIQPAIERFQGRDRIRGEPRFFHSIEFLALLVAAGFVYRLFWVFTLGVVFHMLLDLFVHKRRGRFWVYPDWSHLHCLTYDWLAARRAKVFDPSDLSDPSDPSDKSEGAE
jgi:hypothetical protein